MVGALSSSMIPLEMVLTLSPTRLKARTVKKTELGACGKINACSMVADVERPTSMKPPSVREHKRSRLVVSGVPAVVPAHHSKWLSPDSGSAKPDQDAPIPSRPTWNRASLDPNPSAIMPAIGLVPSTMNPSELVTTKLPLTSNAFTEV